MSLRRCVLVANVAVSLAVMVAPSASHAQSRTPATPLPPPPNASSATPTTTAASEKTLAAPTRLAKTAHLPAWLSLHLNHRVVGEVLRDSFRQASNGPDSISLWQRTILLASIHRGPGSVTLEAMDARGWTDTDSLANNTMVNPLDILQANVGLSADNVLRTGDALAVTFGRMTLDIGNRRLVARNRFRNTINAFNGIDVLWHPRGKTDSLALRVFAVVPVLRRPSDSVALADGELRLDRENTNALLTGIWHNQRFADASLEVYALGYAERDGTLATANRRLLTLGTRFFRSHAPHLVDFEIEILTQRGHSHATSDATDITDLSHRASAFHGEVGYTLRQPYAPRLSAFLDFASGDGDPTDGRNGRFDPLFGARRFDLGPTGSFGALSRSNLISPGLRVDAAHDKRLVGFVAYRPAWLATARDSWTSASLRDKTGAAGRFIGQQIEASLRYELPRYFLSLELGGALLVPGSFSKTVTATSATPLRAVTKFAYAMVTLAL